MSSVVEEDSRNAAPSIASFSTYDEHKSIGACFLALSPRYPLASSVPYPRVPIESRPFDDRESLSPQPTPAPSFFDPNYDTEITWIGEFRPFSCPAQSSHDLPFPLPPPQQRTTRRIRRSAPPSLIMMTPTCL